MVDMKPVAFASRNKDGSISMLTFGREEALLFHRNSDDPDGLFTASQLEQARREEREAIRKAILDESREWTGDYRGPVFRAFEAVARRLGINLTRHQCEAESSRAREGGAA